MKKEKVEIPTVIKLSVGEHWQHQLPGRGAAGYQWFYELETAKDLVEISITPLVKPTRSKNGGEPPDAGSYDECLDIHALRPGKVILRLSQKRSWEKDHAPIKQYQIKITIRDH